MCALGRILDGQAGCNSGVDHRCGMGHDAAGLQVAEAVHECTHGPLHTCGHGERHELQSWAQDSAVTGVAEGAALEAQWHKWAAWWIGRAGCLGCHGIHVERMRGKLHTKMFVGVDRSINAGNSCLEALSAREI